MKRYLSLLVFVILSVGNILTQIVPAYAKQEPSTRTASLTIATPSALLIEAETGTILYQKDEHTARQPASVTKIMTLDLIFDAIEKKQISLSDEVTVSENAASMGGSQVYLEAGEIQTVETMLQWQSMYAAVKKNLSRK